MFIGTFFKKNFVALALRQTLPGRPATIRAGRPPCFRRADGKISISVIYWIGRIREQSAMSGTGFGRFAQFPNGQDCGSDHLGILSSDPFKASEPEMVTTRK
jgi:hypothetical protein